jgi:hypothetical protein
MSGCPVCLAGFKILLSIPVTCLTTGHLAHEAHAYLQSTRFFGPETFRSVVIDRARERPQGPYQMDI